MKLSWKIFRNTFLLVLFALSLAGTIMISMTFQESLSSEIERGKEDMLSMQRDMAVLAANDSRSLYLGEEAVLEAAAMTLDENWTAQGKIFRIRNKEGKVLEQSKTGTFIELEAVENGHLNYRIYKEQGAYHLQMALKSDIGKETFTIEQRRELTSVFVLRNRQQTYFFRIIVSVGILCALLNLLHTLWIARAVSKLTDTVRKVEQGDLTARITSRTKDEIGILAENFNSMADRLENNMNELKEAARKQEEFVGSFAHEIRTPLTSIIGYADLLRRRKLEEEACYGAANYIFTEGKRLESLSLKLLELLVVKEGTALNEMIPVKKLVMEAIRIVEGLLEEKEITLVTELEDFMVKADEALMKTVLVNIIDNARKAVDRKGTIRIGAEKREEECCITVWDNGRGIPEEEIPKIQEAFYRVDKSRSRREGGAGLGLTICANIMKLHEGEIRFESELEKGTKVILLWKGVVNET